MAETDRVRVPTNGHRSALDAAGAQAGQGGAGGATPDRLDDPTVELAPRLTVTPGQLATGFPILAGLILLVAGSRRRGQRRDPQDWAG